MARMIAHFHKRVTFQFANGASGTALIASAAIPCAGEVLHIRQVNSSNTGTKTAQLQLTDEYGNVTFDGTAKAHNASYDHEFVTTRRIIGSKDTLSCTINGDPGAGGYRIDVVVSVFGRDV